MPVDPRPVSKMQHIVEELVQLALKITTAKITTAKVGGAVIFRNVYYHIEATDRVRPGRSSQLAGGRGGRVDLSSTGSAVKKSVL